VFVKNSLPAHITQLPNKHRQSLKNVQKNKNKEKKKENHWI
jgi:hypothetical protein